MIRRGMAMIITLLLLPAAQAPSVPVTSTPPRIGTTTEITLRRETAQTNSDGGSGSSSDRDTLIERIVGVRANGTDIAYDLPKSASAEERASDWQFTARVFRPDHGPLELLDRAALEARVDPWLKQGGMTRAACGHWIFTWNAFRIECDPQTVLRTIERFDIRAADLRDGAPYRDPDARAAAPLHRATDAAGRLRYTVTLAIDPDVIRRARADSALVAAEILRKPLTPEAARAAQAQVGVTGTIAVTFELDATGAVWRRTRLSQVEVTEAGGRVEREVVTETVERRAATEAS